MRTPEALSGTRRRVHWLLAAFARLFDFRMYNPDQNWQHDKEFLGIVREFPGQGRSRHVHERRITLYYLAKSTRSIAGLSAECGVLHGEGSHLIMSARNEEATGMHHIFDSFAGLSEPDQQRDKALAGASWTVGDLAVPQAVVEANLSAFAGRFQCHAGWIPHRFEDVASERFAFVHIDVDLYQPTLDAIAFFYPRLVPGGLIVCDDYGSRLCPGARAAIDHYMVDRPEEVVPLTTGQAFIHRHPKFDSSRR